jgi:sucrose-6-phosphate hydrolase SacC (GH32 family)
VSVSALPKAPGGHTHVAFTILYRPQFHFTPARSGDVGFHPGFAGVQRAPLVTRLGEVRVRILVDASSVEVFGDRDRR